MIGRRCDACDAPATLAIVLGPSALQELADGVVVGAPPDALACGEACAVHVLRELAAALSPAPPPRSRERAAPAH